MAGTFVSLYPARLLDTRSASHTVDGKFQGTGAIGAGVSQIVTIGSRGGVPLSAEAVVVNLTEATATAAGDLALYPAGMTRPNTSSLNFSSGAVTAVQATVTLGSAGQVALYNASGSTNAVLDVVGYYAAEGDPNAGAMYTPQTPTRLYDTRSHAPLNSHEFLTIETSITQTVAVALNVTVVSPKSAGHVTVWPGASSTPPPTSAVNFSVGQTVANMALTGTASDGTAQSFSVGNFSPGPLDLVVDLVGYYAPPVPGGGGSIFVPITPRRIVDTRHSLGILSPLGPSQRAAAPTAPIGSFYTTAIVANVTGILPTVPTYLTLSSAAVNVPPTSSLNLVPNDVRANMAIVAVGVSPDRAFAVYNAAGSVSLAVDAVGYFQTPPPPPLTTLMLATSSSSSTYDTAVTLTATLSGGSSPTGDVGFLDTSNNSRLAVVPVTGGVAVLTTRALAPGSRSLVAYYYGDGYNFAARSSSVPITVAGPVTSVATAFQNDPRHDGADLADTFNPATLHQAWSRQLPSAASPASTLSYPLIAGGRVFVIAVGNQDNLFALDAATGAVDWFTPVTSSYPTFGLTYDGGQVFVQTSDGTISAFDAATGHGNWIVAPAQGSFNAPPTAYDGVLYESAGETGVLSALSELDGKVMWSSTVQFGDISSPTVDDSGVYAYYGCDSYGFNLNGVQRWNDTFGCTGGGGATAVLHGGELYQHGGTGAGGGLILNASDGSSVGTFGASAVPSFDMTNLYAAVSGVLDAVDPSGSPAHWSFPGDGTIDTSPIATNGVVFTGSNAGHVYGINSSTGAQVWTATVPGAVATTETFGTHTGIAAADGMLVVPAGGYVTAYTN